MEVLKEMMTANALVVHVVFALVLAGLIAVLLNNSGKKES